MADVPQTFALQRIYLKDCSLESPASPMIFTKAWKPKFKVDLNTRSQHIAEKSHEVILTVTLTAELDDEKVLLIEVQQAGLFAIEGIEGDTLKQVLGIACPNLLFPYAREAVDSLALKGGFPAVGLQPVNFEALFREAQKQAQAQAAAPAASEAKH
ncbi:preprotein translocase subunit SecB [Litorivivens lipolytica]|uniref:Protein-export protein SecB n=1 Tax=Litorivivens lipolytica TaxID=1524264 RepID=A0A7W4W7S0_9GAMM|nr:protein-export chaperone SecB [Litorivivens lipolytica]MBB3048417.1 preprotein translocase subunit SecB [Litorivivens lipolytica]